MIHPTAVIHPSAQIPADCHVGPHAVIDEKVVLGPGCQIGPHAYLTGGCQLGARNRIHAGCVIGDWPQDIKFKGEETDLIIGNDNVFREHVTIHRSNKKGDPTRIGSHCFLMVNCHVGHNTTLGDYVIIANGALLAGHVTVGDRVFISGNAVVHQFVRIGTLALMQGLSGVSKDVPPYTIAPGINEICGLNTVGLRRAGFTSEERIELRRLYHLFFRSGRKLRETLAEAAQEPLSDKARVLLDFLASGRRGFCPDISQKDQSSDAES